MKKLLLFLLGAVLLLGLSGCDFEFGSIESLMRPPLTATERKLDESIRSLLGNAISLRSPESGNNHSAITLHDLDGDAQNEAIVFYANENASSVVRMSVLKMTDGGWAIVSDFAGNGSGVYSLEFCDLNSDGCDDMLVSWYLFEDKVNKTLTVYSCVREGNQLNFSACATEAYNLLHIEDVLGTGDKQIILAYTDISESTPQTNIRLMRLSKDNRVIQLCKKTLDSRIISLSSVKTDMAAASSATRVFIDAQISDKESLTEILVWDNEKNNFVSLISDIDSTIRSSALSVADINNDGMFEIPERKPLPQSSDSDVSVGFMLVWNEIKGGKLVPKIYSVVNMQGNYRLTIPKMFVGKVYVCSDNSTGHWSFKNSDNQKLFDIVIYDVDDWDKYSKSVTQMLFINNNKVYACNITQEGFDFGVTAQALTESFAINT